MTTKFPITEKYKVAKKDLIKEGQWTRYLITTKTGLELEFHKRDVTEEEWNELKNLRKGSVFALRHTEESSTLVFGWYAKTPTDF